MTSARKVAQGIILYEMIDAVAELVLIIILSPYLIGRWIYRRHKGKNIKTKEQSHKHVVVTCPEARYRPEENKGTTRYN